MYIKSIDIVNYRLFYGKHHFEFDSNFNKSLNIIFGKHGSGKSSFIDAFYWCLYGKETWVGGSEPIYYDNILDSSLIDNHFDVKVILSMIDEHGKEVLVKRAINFYKKDDGGIFQKSENFEIYINNNPVLYPHVYVHKNCPTHLFDLCYVNELGDFSFFDKSMKLLVVNYFQLDIIDNAYIHSCKSYDKFLKQYKMQGPIVHLRHEHQLLLDEYNNVCVELDNIYKNLYELEEIHDRYLRANNSFKDLFDKRQYLLNKLSSIDERINKLRSKYSYLVANSFPMVVLFNDLCSEPNLLENLFDDLEDDNQITYFAENFYNNLNFNLNDLKENMGVISNYIKEIKRLMDVRENVVEEIYSINISLDGVDYSLANEMKLIEKKRGDLIKLSEMNKVKESLLKKDIDRIEKQIHNTSIISDKLDKKLTFHMETIDILENMKYNLFKDILNEFSDFVNEIFIQDFQMSSKFSSIVFDDDFNFNIIKNSGMSIIFSDLSTSEKYMLYLSFALSVQKIIDKDLFLIIDTQFLNFDEEQWLNFLSLLKKTNCQYFLLFNENKYDDNTKLSLMDNINRVYELINENDKVKVIDYENNSS